MAEERDARIHRLPELLEALAPAERTLARQLFQIVVSEGTLQPTPEMAGWLANTFGSVEATLHQRVVRVTNRWTFEGASFNALRARRPGSGATQQDTARERELRERIERSSGDDFCAPEQRTPADAFGRVRGRHVLTASNVAKAEGWHGVAIFDRHDPLAIDAALVADLLDVAERWAAQAHAADEAARYFFLLWNCLWRAGASLTHGHAQLTLASEMAQARVELWRVAAERYHRETGGVYFADLVRVHRALGLDVPMPGGTVGYASLTPVKEREVVLLAPAPGQRTLGSAPERLGLEQLAGPLATTLETMLGRLGVRAFNVAIFGPPLAGGHVAAAAPDTMAAWEGFPLVARFVDRGDPLSQTSDIAALELFGTSVVASDPFDLAQSLRG